MAAGEGGAGTTSCPACHKRYPWRDALDGKKVKCKCGNVFEAALDLEGALPDHDDRTYDVAEDYIAPREPTAAVPMTGMSTGIATGISTGPILPEAAKGGSVAGAYPRRKKVLTYAHATPAEAAEIRDRSALREWFLPIGILGVGVLCYVAQLVLSSGGGGTAAGRAGSAFLGVVLEVGLIL